jgi:hypothetical protein
MKISVTKNISFKYFYKFEFSKQFNWSLGVIPQYWYQVTGCCKNSFTQTELDSEGNEVGITLNDVCPPINTNQNCSYNNSQYFQVILGSNPEDVCQNLKENNWDWKICEFKRWSKPAENLYADPFDDCNTLEDVNWKELIECYAFNIQQSFLEILNFDISVSIIENSAIEQIEQPLSQVYFDEDLVNSEIDYSVEQNLFFESNVAVKSISFFESYSNRYFPSSNNIIVSCKNCNILPDTLYVDNNLLNLNYFNSFLYKNDYELSDEIALLYSKNTNLWSSLINFRDKYNNDHWRVLLSLGCSGEKDSDFYYWKFSLNFIKINSIEKTETRLLVSVPSEFICKYTQDIILSFEYNIYTKYLFINYETYYDNFYFIDEIGLFDSIYWRDNPKLKMSVTRDKIKKRINKKTIVV